MQTHSYSTKTVMTSVLMEVCTKYRRSTKESQAGPGGGKQ